MQRLSGSALTCKSKALLAPWGVILYVPFQSCNNPLILVILFRKNAGDLDYPRSSDCVRQGAGAGKAPKVAVDVLCVGRENISRVFSEILNSIVRKAG